MNEVLIVDNQFSVLKRSAEELVDKLPCWLKSVICKIGEKDNEVRCFLDEDRKREEVKMIVLHASGIGSTPVASISQVCRLYNGGNGMEYLHNISVPIVVTSNGAMDEFGALPVLRWSRARWVQKAHEVSNTDDLVRRAKEELADIANLHDLHSVYRTVFVVKRLCESGRHTEQGRECPLLSSSETLEIIQRVYTGNNGEEVLELAQECFGSGVVREVVERTIRAVNENCVSYTSDIDVEGRIRAVESLNNLLTQLNIATERLKFGA